MKIFSKKNKKWSDSHACERLTVLRVSERTRDKQGKVDCRKLKCVIVFVQLSSYEGKNTSFY